MRFVTLAVTKVNKKQKKIKPERKQVNFYKKKDRKESLNISNSRKINSRQIKVEEQKRGQGRGKRQDHRACRATQEEREEQIGLYKKMKQMSTLSENCPHRKDIEA